MIKLLHISSYILEEYVLILQANVADVSINDLLVISYRNKSILILLMNLDPRAKKLSGREFAYHA